MNKVKPVTIIIINIVNTFLKALMSQFDDKPHDYHDHKQNHDDKEQRAPCSSRRILGRAGRWGPSGRLQGNKASVNHFLGACEGLVSGDE